MPWHYLKKRLTHPGYPEREHTLAPERLFHLVEGFGGWVRDGAKNYFYFFMCISEKLYSAKWIYMNWIKFSDRGLANGNHIHTTNNIALKSLHSNPCPLAQPTKSYRIEPDNSSTNNSAYMGTNDAHTDSKNVNAEKKLNLKRKD